MPPPPTAHDAAALVSDVVSHKYGLAVLGGRVFARRGLASKSLEHVRILLDATRRRGVRNVVVAHDSSADGSCQRADAGEGRALPTTLIAKRRGTESEPCGVLVLFRPSGNRILCPSRVVSSVEGGSSSRPAPRGAARIYSEGRPDAANAIANLSSSVSSPP